MSSALGRQASPVLHFDAARLERVFARCFADRFQTRLCGGAEEPLYQPASSATVRDVPGEHLLYYRSDYFASALHEISHWCIAGPQRRLQVDFGYWYAPEGRTAAQQQAFETAEQKPQALEWFFSRACAYDFRLSADNLDESTGELHDTAVFARAVLRQVLHWQAQGLPTRAALFYRGLCLEFRTRKSVPELAFAQAQLL